MKYGGGDPGSARIMLVKPAAAPEPTPAEPEIEAGDWSFDTLDPELQAAILRGREQAARGDVVPAAAVLEDLRRRRSSP